MNHNQCDISTFVFWEYHPAAGRLMDAHLVEAGSQVTYVVILIVTVIIKSYMCFNSNLPQITLGLFKAASVSKVSAHTLRFLSDTAPSPVKKSVEPKKVACPGWTCWECDRLFAQRDVHISHARKEHGKQMKKHPCHQSDKSLSWCHSLCRCNRIEHKGIQDPNAKEMTDATHEEEVELREDTKAPSPKRKLEEPVLESRPPRGTITQPLKKLEIDVFKVHKGTVHGFTSEDLLQFHEHIPQPRSDGSSSQCRECGLGYTSHVSLSRSLCIVHKLKEPQPVSRRNGAGEDGQQEDKPSHEDEDLSRNTSTPDGSLIIYGYCQRDEDFVECGPQEETTDVQITPEGFMFTKNHSALHTGNLQKVRWKGTIELGLGLLIDRVPLTTAHVPNRSFGNVLEAESPSPDFKGYLVPEIRLSIQSTGK
ncbi:zinc finger protein 532-like, partial [Carlito syrichta]|uniref:Zinc finger protein 532-like n=1 Tax=Carlito syrichta TaxID=1868482 RepID=A0A3Q0EC95_CARSF